MLAAVGWTFLLAAPAGPERGADQNRPGPGFVEAKADLFLVETVVALRDGRVFGGGLMGIEGDALVLSVANAPKKFLRSDLDGVEIRRKRDRTPAIVTGGLISAYLFGVDFFDRDDYARLKPPHFYSGRLSLEFLESMGSGLFFGWLVGRIGGSGSEAFDLSGGSRQPEVEWERLRTLVAGGPSAAPRLHLTVRAGQITRRAIRTYMGNALPSIREYDYRDERTGFNLLRCLRLSYSIKPAWDIGYAWAFLGEPCYSGYLDSSSAYGHFEAVQDTSGHYLTIGYQPRFSRLGPKILGEIGLGLGAAWVRFRTWGERTTLGIYAHTEDDAGLAKTVPSVLAFTEWNVRLFSHLSVGLAADFAWMPRQSLPALEVLEIPARRLSLSSGSVGFAFGFHY